MPKVLWTDHQIAILIDEYEKNPILYNENHPEFKDTIKRNETINYIFEIIKEVRPDTTKIEIIKKIRGFRNTFESECSKILESEKIATCPEEVYTPNLWYFYKLRFLNKYIKTNVSFRNLFYNMYEYPDEENYEQLESDESELDFSIVKPEDLLNDDNLNKIENDIKLEPNSTEYDLENDSKIKNKRKTINSQENFSAEPKRTNFDNWKKSLIQKLDHITDENLRIDLQDKINELVSTTLTGQQRSN